MRPGTRPIAASQGLRAWPSNWALMGTTQGTSFDTNRATLTFDRMINRKLPLGLSFLAQDTWDNMAGTIAKVRNTYSGFIGIRSNIVISVPLLMSGSTLADVAAGIYDSYFTTAAQTIAADFPSAKVRIGWENCAPWFVWGQSGTNAEKIAAFQHVSTLFKTISPTFEINWNPDKLCGYYRANGSVDFPDIYPGDAYVDSIGIENYAQWLNSIDAPTSGSTFPYTTPEPTVKQVERWTNCALGNINDTFAGAGSPRPFCLLRAKQFADQHGKPLTIPEWGVGFDSLRNGRHVGDDAYHVVQMLQWIRDNNVAWHCYFDKIGDSAAYNCRQSYSSNVTGLATGDPNDEKPLCSAAFIAGLG